MMIRTGQQLAIVRALTVVEVFRSGDYGVVQRIPHGSVVRYRGPSKLRNMVTLEWHDELYSAFEQDVSERTAPVNGTVTHPRQEERASKISVQCPGGSNYNPREAQINRRAYRP